MEAGSLKKTSNIDDIHSRIAVSSDDNNIECRISLGRAPVGAKCVAPCGCMGSQKWVQFAELNKLRRKDPSQWRICPTCQQKFDYSMFVRYGGLQANLVGYVLDHAAIFRAATVTTVLTIGYIASMGSLLSRFLVSRPLWQLYPTWSKLTHIPLALKFWALRVLMQYVGEKYMYAERTWILSYLADLETQLIEENLPVPVEQ